MAPCLLDRQERRAYGPQCPAVWDDIGAYGQMSLGKLTTMGVAVLRTTTHRNGSCFEELISMWSRKAGT
jgi:hypothetical protein